MKPSEALNLHRAEIRKIVAQYHATNVRVFGSVLYGEDTEDSDLDLLVDATKQTTLLDIAKIQNRLQKLLKISVDVLTPKALSKRYAEQIIQEAIPV